MAFALTAVITLLVMPTVRINVGYSMTADQIAQAFPSEGEEGEGSDSGIDFKEMLGDEGISLDLSLSVDSKLLFNSLTGDPQTVIEENFVEPNVKNIAASLKKPLGNIGQGMLKYMVTAFYTKTYESAIDSLKSDSETRTTKEIRIAGGIDDDYLKGESEDVMTELNKNTATVTSLSNVMFNSLLNGTKKFNNAKVGYTIPEMGEDQRGKVKDTVKEMLDGLGMVKEDGESLYPINIVMDAMIVGVFRESSKTEAPENETIEQKAAALDKELATFIKGMIPSESYSTLAMVLKIVLIVLLVFVGIWGLLFIYTLLRTLLAKKKVWTMTGPIFWILGLLQIILGIGLTAAVSVLMNSGVLNSIIGNSAGSSGGEEAASMMAGLKLSIMTSMFIPSIILLIMIPFMIVYAVMKHKYKRELKAAAQAPIPAPTPAPAQPQALKADAPKGDKEFVKKDK